MSTHIRKFFSYAVRLPRHTLLGSPSAGRLATAPARPSARSPASVSTGRFHRSNLLGQKARGPLRPRILYRGREQSRADPRPAGVRVSLPKQRPKRGERLWQTLCTSSSDVYPCLKIFTRHAPSKMRRATHLTGRCPATAPARPPNRSPAPAVTGRLHRSNLHRQKARGPLRPQRLYRGRDRDRADPRPALVRISLQKQRPRRRGRLLETIRAPPSDFNPCLKIFFVRRAPSKTLPARTPPAGRLATAPTQPPNRSSSLARQAALTNPLGQKARGPLRPRILHRGRDQSRADPRPAWVRVSLQSSDLSGASARGRRYALRPMTSTHV